MDNTAGGSCRADPGRWGLRLLELPAELLEALVANHVAPAALPALRGVCKRVKQLVDRRVNRLRIPFGDLQLHSFFRTDPLAHVSVLTLELPASLPQPLAALLPPLAFAGLRRHLPALADLRLNNVHFPAAANTGAAAPGAGGSGGASAGAHAYCLLDLAGIERLSVAGLAPGPRGVWRGSGCNPFPMGLGPSLLRAAPRLRALSLSLVTFTGRDGDMLSQLTALQELHIRSCNSNGANLTCLSLLTGLTALSYADISYKVGVPNELNGLSELTGLREIDFTNCDFYPAEVAHWTTWGCLTKLCAGSRWQMTLDAISSGPMLVSCTALRELQLPDHLLDRPMWTRLTEHLTRLESARFGWACLPADRGAAPAGPAGGAAVDLEAGAGSGSDSSDEDVQPQQPFAPVVIDLVAQGAPLGAAPAAPAPAQAPRRALQPHPSLRCLRLDGPYAGDACRRPLLPLLPRLEELRVGGNAEALAAMARDDPSVYARFVEPRFWSHMLSTPPGGGAPGAPLPPLQRLDLPLAWLPAILQLGPLPHLRGLRLLALPPLGSTGGSGAGAGPAAAAAAAAALRISLEEGALRRAVMAPLVLAQEQPRRLGVPLWPALHTLEVPFDLDAAVLAPLCGAVLHLAVRDSYGDGLLALMHANAGVLPRLRRLTLGGTLHTLQAPHAYARALKCALALRGVQQLEVRRRAPGGGGGAAGTKPSPMTAEWFSERRRQQGGLALEAWEMVEVEVVPEPE